ncbi:hypothetical protein EMIT0P260_20393 [Pseudomonas sp. IT-P260]
MRSRPGSLHHTAICGGYYVACYVIPIKKGPALLQALVLYGAGTRNRTRDLLITSQLLYQLSYTGVWATIIAIGLVL